MGVAPIRMTPPIHMAQGLTECFNEDKNDVNLMLWPSPSPHLYTVEHVGFWSAVLSMTIMKTPNEGISSGRKEFTSFEEFQRLVAWKLACKEAVLAALMTRHLT